MKLLGISGNRSLQVKTDIAIKKALSFAEISAGVRTEFLNLQGYDCLSPHKQRMGTETSNTIPLIEKVKQADALIIGAPIYCNSSVKSITNMLDLLPEKTLAGKVIGFISICRTDEDYDVIDAKIELLADYYEAHFIPIPIMARNEHFEEESIKNVQLIEGLRELGESIVNLHRVFHLEEENPYYMNKVSGNDFHF